ncbi:MAG: ArnT family glycosyltransferase [Acidimicrobiia bacterium]
MPDSGSHSSSVASPDRFLLGIVASCGLLAALVRIPTVLAARHLSFDDGVYGASTLAMRAGGVPYRSVFSSQGPAFLPLVWCFDLITGRTAASPRTLAVVSGICATVCAAMIATYFVPRTARRWCAAIAGLLTALSGALWWTTGPITSDGPTVALSCAAIWIACSIRTRASWARAVSCGVLLGAAIAIKLVLAGPAVVVCVLLIATSPNRRLVLKLLLPAAAIPVVASVAFGVARVWEQVVTYHLESEIGSRNPLVHLGKLASTLVDRDPTLVVLAVVALIAAIVNALRHRRAPISSDAPAPDSRLARLLTSLGSGATPLVLWLISTVAVLAVQQPLWRNHVAYVVAPLATLVAITLAQPRAFAIATLAVIVVALPVQAYRTRALWNPSAYSGTEGQIETVLRALPPDRLAISDDPGLVWRAGTHGNNLRTPDNFVDTSVLRITSPVPSIAISTPTVLAATSDARVCAVIQTSAERFGALPDLGSALMARSWNLTLNDGSYRMWTNPTASCQSATSAPRPQ